MLFPREVSVRYGRNATLASVPRSGAPRTRFIFCRSRLLAFEHQTRLSARTERAPTLTGQFFSVGRSSQRHNAGRNTIAAIMLTTNMKVSITPMSAWNFKSENTHVPTPTASVSAV